MSRITSGCLLVLTLFSFGVGNEEAASQDVSSQESAINPDPRVTWMHYEDPEIVLLPDQAEWPEEQGKLWGSVLFHEESDLRREAADSIAMTYSLGMPIDPSMIEGLLAVIRAPNEQLVTVAAAANALAVIDARETAEDLAKLSSLGSIPLSLRIDETLARWDYAPMRDQWLARLQDPDHQRILVISAVRSLGEVKESRAAVPLTKFVFDRGLNPSLRIVAARSLAQFEIDGRLGLAKKLLEQGEAKDKQEVALDTLLAAILLSAEESAEAIGLLDTIAQGEIPTAMAEAMRKLLQVAPDRLVAKADRYLKERDANVRQLTVEALATAVNEQSVVQLASVLGDPVPDVRKRARHILLETMAADAALQPLVIEQAERILATEDWRSVEQAILIATALDQKQVGERLLELVDHPRHEVFLTACWGLKLLRPEPLREQIYQTMLRLIDEGKTPIAVHRYWATGQLAEAMAMMDHKPAIEVLKTLVPKEAPMNFMSRAAAVWALGHLLEDSKDAEVARMLEARLADSGTNPPEWDEVRALSAISLGRIKADSSLKALRTWGETEGAESFVGRRCYWGIREMTGEPIPDVEPKVRQLGDFFLQPAS